MTNGMLSEMMGFWKLVVPDLNGYYIFWNLGKGIKRKFPFKQF